MEKLEGYKRPLFLGAVIIALGITFTTVLKETVGSIGIVFIAVGGLFFIIGMNYQRIIYKKSLIVFRGLMTLKLSRDGNTDPLATQ